MEHDELDGILRKQDEIQPSSGFAASVMEAVQRESAAPPPLPFPWKRALPVLLLAVFAVVVVVVLAVASIMLASREAATLWAPPSSLFDLIPQGRFASTAGWIAGALLTAWVTVTLSVRLASGRV